MTKLSIWQKKPVRGFLLSLSSLAAVSLFGMPSSLVTLILAGILGLAAFNGLIGWKDPMRKIEFRPGALLLAISFAAIGFLLFPGNMAYTHGMTQLAETLHVPYLVNASLFAAALCLLGFYAFYRLAYRMEEDLMRILGFSADRQDAFSLSNLIFPLSALVESFFCHFR